MESLFQTHMLSNGNPTKTLVSVLVVACTLLLFTPLSHGQDFSQRQKTEARVMLVPTNELVPVELQDGVNTSRMANAYNEIVITERTKLAVAEVCPEGSVRGYKVTEWYPGEARADFTQCNGKMIIIPAPKVVLEIDAPAPLEELRHKASFSVM